MVTGKDNGNKNIDKEENAITNTSTDYQNASSDRQLNIDYDFCGMSDHRSNAPHFSQQGLFITFEGIDGSGKTTQIQKLNAYLEQKNYVVRLTREPGGTELGKRIRHLLLDKTKDMPVSPRAEALLYAADRAQHIQQIVKPALHNRNIVLSDRYMDSSLAYQAHGRDLSQFEIYNMSLWAAQGLRPQRIYLLDVDPRSAQSRYIMDHEDRIEAEGIEFQKNVRNAFLDLAQQAPTQWIVINASQDTHSVWEDIRKDIDELLTLPKYADLARR